MIATLTFFACSDPSPDPDNTAVGDDTALSGTDTAGTDTGTEGTDSGTDTGTPPPPLPCEGQTTGTTMGTCGEDFTLPDGTGSPVSLYDFAGNVILLDISGFN